MATFGEIQAEIVDALDGRSDLTTQIKREINRAIKFYSAKSWWFKETSESFYTSEGQDRYDKLDGVPPDIANILFMRVDDGTGERNLDPITVGDSFGWIKSPLGAPSEYALFAGSVWLRQTPNNDITKITVYYIKKYVDLVDDDDTNDFTEYADELVVQRALSMIYSKVLKDVENATVAKQGEIEALMSVNSQSTKFTMKGHIKPWQ